MVIYASLKGNGIDNDQRIGTNSQKGHNSIPDVWNWLWAASQDIPGREDPIPASSAGTQFAHRPQRRYPPPRGSFGISLLSATHPATCAAPGLHRESAMAMRMRPGEHVNPGIRRLTQGQRARPWRRLIRIRVNSRDIRREESN